jgi:hypothetical protein
MEHPRYAFVVNVPPFPNIYLVDMSPNTNLQYNQVQVFEPNVRYCTPVMDIVLQEIQENGPFFQKYWIEIQDNLYETLCDDANHTMEQLHTVVFTTIISMELIILSDQPGIRMNSDLLELIGVETNQLRRERIENEADHTTSLLLDCQLSLQELQVVVASNAL